LEQQGVTLAPSSSAWKTFRASATAPAGATRADLSVQMRRGGYSYLLGDFAARVNNQPVSLPNADLSQRGDRFLDLGHEDAPARWGSDGIGIGGFAGPGNPDKPAPGYVSPGDPLKLSRLFSGRAVVPQRPAPQWLDPASVPKGVKIVPAVGEPSRPLVALVVHENGAFKGAVDAWTFRAKRSRRCSPKCRWARSCVASGGTATASAFRKATAWRWAVASVRSRW
jgi:hypothetical protein